MINKKARPVNGPGNNGLRGGTKLYSTKTFQGNFIDDVGGPEGFKRGFHNEDYMTEQQNQQMGRTLKFDRLYGADLPLESKLKPRTTTDIFNPPTGMQSSEWKTNAQLTLVRHKVQDERLPHLSTLKGEKLDEYRNKWTSDNPIGRLIRFQTEAQRSANEAVPEKFRVNRVRFMPGTPLAMEKLREKLIERFGILAFSSVRHALGPGKVSGRELQSSLKELGVEITKAEFCQILAYLTQDEEFESSQFLKILKGTGNTLDTTDVSKKFNESFPNGPASKEEIISLLRYDIHFDLAKGIEIYLSCYLNSEDLVDMSCFILLHQDLFLSSPEAYFVVKENIWA